MIITSGRKGFALIATGVCVASLLGMLGLALDLGRVYVAKNETQSFTDTAAMAGTPLAFSMVSGRKSLARSAK